MAFITDEKEIYDLYEQAEMESKAWREDYHEYERLADNDLIENLDETLPEVNDGSLAASLYKLPKRIVNSNLKGRAKALDSDDAWLTELANIQWENYIIPNANSQAPFHRKWKDAVRKAAIYGGVPIISLFVNRGEYIGADFITAQPQDVLLEPGKVSDYDSDIVFWEVYYTKQQVRTLIERAKAENKSEDGYNKWNIDALKEVLKYSDEEEREPLDDHRQTQGRDVRRKGYKFCIVFQRGVEAPFYMYHKGTKKTVREWTNPDPTGDIPIHFLYCYQDFVNPYGTGIVKLAGGTQNVLDYMRQADVLATQLGLRPPVSIAGDTSDTDLDSIVYAQDAQWMVGTAKVEREEISNQVYSQLPGRISMYKTSLNQLIPVGDTSIAGGESGDPQYSKTPAGVKFQAQSLSIDDEDFKDNLYMTYAAVAKSMINIHFANMQGSDIMKLSEDERKILEQAGIPFPIGENGEPTSELEILWDEARGTFDFEVDAEQDKTKDEEKRLEGLLRVMELKASDPTLPQELALVGKKLNVGELLTSIIQLTTDNDKIVEDITPEDQAVMQGQMAQGPVEGEPPADEGQAIQMIMQQYEVDEPTAMAMLQAESEGFEPEEILEAVSRNGG